MRGAALSACTTFAYFFLFLADFHRPDRRQRDALLRTSKTTAPNENRAHEPQGRRVVSLPGEPAEAAYEQSQLQRQKNNNPVQVDLALTS